MRYKIDGGDRSSAKNDIVVSFYGFYGLFLAGIMFMCSKWTEILYNRCELNDYGEVFIVGFCI